MFNEEDYLFQCAAEECAEIIQRISKGHRFTLEEVQPGQEFSNRERIAQERDDFQGVLSLLYERGMIRPIDPVAVEAKRAKVLKFMEYSRQRGRLEPVKATWE